MRRVRRLLKAAHFCLKQQVLGHLSNNTAQAQRTVCHRRATVLVLLVYTETLLCSPNANLQLVVHVDLTDTILQCTHLMCRSALRKMRVMLHVLLLLLILTVLHVHCARSHSN
jgi:hypothetical protein